MRKQSPHSLPVLFALLVTAASCATTDDEHTAAAHAAVARTGPWLIPTTVRASAATQDVTITEAGLWVGTSGCSGSFTEGARIFGDYLLENFPQVSDYGGYDCRPIVGAEDWMSVHATGRALDLFIPVDSDVASPGDADNDAGDAVANWLIANAEYIGVQRVIWDRWIWQADSDPTARDGAYDFAGSHPHNDHIHMELSVEASEMDTEFFSGPMDPPVLTGCAALPAEGGIIDNSDACFQAFGSPTYWRQVEGAGIGGSYIWTNAFSSTDPSNWARWAINLTRSGHYEVEVHVIPAHAVFARTQYEIRRAEGSGTVIVDQSAHAAWVTLGEFDFVSGGAQSVSVYDNASGTVPSNQNICVDAIRVTNLDPVEPTDGGVGIVDGGVADAAPEDTDGGGLPRDAGANIDGAASGDASSFASPRMSSGCSVSAHTGSPTPLLAGLFALLYLVASRRRTRR